MKHKELVLKMKELFAPYRKNLIIISVIMIITSIGSFLTPWLTKQLIDIGIMKGNFLQTVFYVGLIFIIFFAQQLFGAIQFYYYRNISLRIPFDLNNQACKHVLLVRTKYFKDRNFSEVMSELFQDISNISSLTDTQFLSSFVSLFKIVAGLVALFLINWKLTLIMLATIPIKVLISSYLFKKQESIYKVIMRVQSNFSAWLGDGISGIVEIKLWGIINKKLSKLNDILENSMKAKSRLMFCGYIDNVAGSTLSILFTCILYLFGSWLIQKNEMSIGSLVSFVSYSSLVFEPIGIISYLITQLSLVKPAFERFLRFLSTDIENDNPGSIELPNSMDIKQIKFENVSLVYDEEKALDHVSFTINKGEKIAIIGFNGSGKTSIVNLLLRFYEPTEGVIKINNNDIRTYTFESYRSMWSLMAQDNYMFNDTIKNNINISEELSMDEIIESCKKSGAYSFIQELPEKFETRIGYNGSKLSGGQRQKVALARTLARKNTKALILDEATSSYDYYSEQNFNEDIVSSSCYIFTIIITHRPEVLKKLDRIIYLDKGRVMGTGTFDELYESMEGFRNIIVNTQNKEMQDHAVHAFSN
ncbi:ABC transporter ATP-binding protein [Paenibacillus oralis]|uniref:ABC transporter ATP-binding protein n=1 Tax=Paenibacillus oralis TaxID=2490856 RepID=A0A3P3UF72_9BACL|nr:ABC transporter ATP-binding protein [Paenibacillus oralis]RRJ67113.1 ABC transporter ATP-binding protein [Paenibacillus oralis]